jgi:diguanylate cyclase (GGDEF)-like protein/PAS domain S-box-containing protein
MGAVMSPTQPPVKVLVVDDVPASRGLAAIWLSDGLRGGVEVLEAASLGEMRVALAEHRPDVVLLDQRLPDGEGLDGARSLLAADPDAAVILLTGMADPALDEEAERAGVTDFLVKHEIDGPMLARAVRYALRRREDRMLLRRSEERNRNLIAALPDAAVMVVDEQLQFVVAAGEALSRAGWEADELVGRDAVGLLESAGRGVVLDHYRAALAGVDGSHEHVGGGGRTYRTVFRPVGGEAMAVTFDITEQLAAAVELQRAQALAMTGSWRWEAATDELVWSPELCRLYGLDPSQPLLGFGEWLETLVAPEDRAEVMAVTRAAQEGASADFSMAIVRRSDGARRVLHSRVRPVLGGDGRLIRIEGISQDVTELREAQDALREGEEQLRLVLGNLPRVVVAVYDNELSCRLIEGGTLPSEAYGVLDAALAMALQGEESTLDVTAAGGGPDGAARELELTVAPHRGLQGQIAGALVVARDVTEQRAAERRFEVAFDRAPFGMFLATLDGRFLRVNRALCELSGYGADELLAFGPLAIVPEEDRLLVESALASVGDGDVRIEHRLVGPGEHEAWVVAQATLVRDAAGTPLHVLGQMQDVTERREYEERLRHLADHDTLTGLLNRRAFEEALDAHVARVRRYGAAGALLLLDLDGFKDVNDTLGHHAGDALLVRVAAALGERLRETDVLARLGGDEFAVLLPMESCDAATLVAGALVDVVRGLDAGVTASVGVAVVADGEGAVTAEGLMIDADRAMYAAKGAGRDGVRVHGPRADSLT